VARPLRIEYPGAFYHVTTRGNEQKEIFKSQRDREQFLSYLESATERYGAVIHAYCLMSNHYHLMLETPQGNLSQIMKHINSSYTTYFNVKRKRAGHLLQGRFKAILVEADSYATELTRYIHLNPVRAKIVETPEAYPWMSYRCYTEGVAPSWLTTGFILGYFGRKATTARENYRHFVHELIEREYSSPLQGTIASTILGSAEFVSEIQERHLRSRKADRDLPALRELNEKPSLHEIMKVVSEVFAENDRQAKKAGIFLCHRYSGAKLKEIGELFRLTESGVTRASKRFDEVMERDKALKKKMVEIRRKLKLSNA
jgi:REP element-mobilizing transposase RayT